MIKIYVNNNNNLKNVIDNPTNVTDSLCEWGVDLTVACEKRENGVILIGDLVLSSLYLSHTHTLIGVADTCDSVAW